MADFRSDLLKADNSQVIERKVSINDIEYSEEIRTYSNSMTVAAQKDS